MNFNGSIPSPFHKHYGVITYLFYMQRLVDQSKKHSPKEMVKVKVDFYFFNHKLNESTNPIITTKKNKNYYDV